MRASARQPCGGLVRSGVHGRVSGLGRGRGRESLGFGDWRRGPDVAKRTRGKASGWGLPAISRPSFARPSCGLHGRLHLRGTHLTHVARSKKEKYQARPFHTVESSSESSAGPQGRANGGFGVGHPALSPPPSRGASPHAHGRGFTHMPTAQVVQIPVLGGLGRCREFAFPRLAPRSRGAATPSEGRGSNACRRRCDSPTQPAPWPCTTS